MFDKLNDRIALMEDEQMEKENLQDILCASEDAFLERLHGDDVEGLSEAAQELKKDCELDMVPSTYKGDRDFGDDSTLDDTMAYLQADFGENDVAGEDEGILPDKVALGEAEEDPLDGTDGKKGKKGGKVLSEEDDDVDMDDDDLSDFEDDDDDSDEDDE